MQIIVASKNPIKIRATAAAFRAQFPEHKIEVEGLSVDSGVADQPMSDEETRRGAQTRAANTQAAKPDADFWVGLEGGVDVIEGTLMTFAWMAIKSASGEFSQTRSPTLPLPPAIKTLVASGVELGEANDRVFATLNSKQGGGAYGLLTEGRYTRESIYTQTLVIALIPFVNPLYPQR
jgi:inosine/xanthosine triphosphatase